MAQQFFDKDALGRLQNNTDFLLLLHYVHQCREAHIHDLHGADTAGIQQLSGRVLALDELLRIVGYAEMKEKFARMNL